MVFVVVEVVAVSMHEQIVLAILLASDAREENSLFSLVYFVSLLDQNTNECAVVVLVLLPLLVLVVEAHLDLAVVALGTITFLGLGPSASLSASAPASSRANCRAKMQLSIVNLK